MSETQEENDQPIPRMHRATVSGKKFFVQVAGKTNGAHKGFIAKLKRQVEVDSPEESHYVLVFCPVASRVGTDIGEALESIPGDKPTILVVMHHTFNPDIVLGQSRRLVNNPNILLTVDCLIYKGKLLECKRNDVALSEVKNLIADFSQGPAKKEQLQRGLCCW